MPSIGAVALLSSQARAVRAWLGDGGAGLPDHRPRARRIIHLYMAGGPSHLETFDEKPVLREMDGEPMPESITKGQQVAQLQGKKLVCFAPRFEFQSFGQSGQRIAKIFPHLGSVADRLCIIRSMQGEQINHDPAHTLFNTGTTLPGRPSMGSWLTYALGRSTRDLPSFVVLTSVGKGGQAQPIAARQWHSGFLPSQYQGVELRSKGDPVLYVSRPPGVDAGGQDDVIRTVQAMNDAYADRHHDDEARARSQQYELARRMQESIPELVDFRDEPSSIRDLYGSEGADGTFAGNCLLARRMAERGVRFVQVYHRGWDHHGSIQRSMEITAGEVDRAAAALIQDLAQRGMLEDTLVLFGGEFGRTPMGQGSGRDHHIRGYSYAMAGAGVRGGMSYGATDEFGYHAVENIVHVRDLHATVLHLMGLDHERLSVPFRGLDVRLTGVEPARVLHPILA